MISQTEQPLGPRSENSLIPKLRGWVARSASLAAASLIGFALLEWGLRTFAPIPTSWLSIYALHPRLPYTLQPNVEQSIDTGVTRWTVAIDGDGMRVGTQGPIARAEPHWLAIGDSFAFGHGVDSDLGLVARLEAETGVRIANAAIPGYGPAEYRAMLAEHVDREGLSGILVVAYLGNDFHDALWGKTVSIHDGILGLTPGWKGYIKRRSHVYRLMTNTMHRLGVGAKNSTLDVESDLVTPNRWSNYLDAAEPIWVDSYRGIKEIASARDVPVVVIVIPNRAAVDNAVLVRVASAQRSDSGSVAPMLARDKAKEWIERAGLRVVDATDALLQLKSARFLPFDGHLTPEANEHIARELATLVTRALAARD